MITDDITFLVIGEITDPPNFGTWPDTLVGLRESKRWLQDNHNRKLV